MYSGGGGGTGSVHGTGPRRCVALAHGGSAAHDTALAIGAAHGDGTKRGMAHGTAHGTETWHGTRRERGAGIILVLPLL